MPNHKSCKKRMKQDVRRRARNNFVKTTIKTLTKKFKLSEMTIEEKQASLRDIYSKLDKAAKKGVIHKRTASRRKSRLAKYFDKLLKAEEKTE